MKNLFYMIFAGLTIVTSSTAIAAKGEVIYYKSGCDYYIVETPKGFALLEWFGGNDPNEGDTLAGDFETYGMKEIYNLNAVAETDVWVDEYWLSKSDAVEHYFEKCN